MATVRINCENRNRKRTVDLSKVRKTASIVLEGLGVREAELNIVFVSDAKIRALNRRYLGSSSATDVIAFQEKGAGRRAQGAGRGFLGEMAISSDTAARNAKKYGVEFKREIALLVIHGTLHLMGFEDVSARGRIRMRKKEDEFLQKAKDLP
jgi:probable rRNA maturation factor